MRTGAAFLLLAAVVASQGCAPARPRLAGDEARAAGAFFARAASDPFPPAASFSGTAAWGDRAVPVVVAYSVRAGGETAGLFDPFGRAVLLATVDGGLVVLRRGPAADGTVPELSRIPTGGVSFDAGPLSLGRLLSGAPGYPVGEGEALAGDGGGWAFACGPQTLFSDPGRRFLSRAEYDLAGRRVRVDYPGRTSPDPPLLVTIEASGGKISLRRDEE